MSRIETNIPIPKALQPRAMRAEQWIPELPLMLVGDSVLVDEFPADGEMRLEAWEEKHHKKMVWQVQNGTQVRVWRVE